VTEVRLRRKRIQKEDKIKRWKRALTLTTEYKKVYDTWAGLRRAALHDIKQQRKQSRESNSNEKPAEVKAQPIKKEVKKEESKKIVPKKTVKT